MSKIKKPNRIGQENLYERIDSTNLIDRSYPNEEILKIKLPMRALVLGPSDSGKTIIAINMINAFGCWDRVVILTKKLDEPLFKWAIERMRAIEKEQGRSICLAIDKIADLPALDTFKEEQQTLFIVDDFVEDDPKSLLPLSEFWVRGRKNGVSSVFISQSFFSTPKIIRKNSNLVFIKKLGNAKDFNRIAQEYALSDTAAQIAVRYNKVMKDSDCTDFFLIDKENKDSKLVFRDGYEPMD